MDFLVDNQAPNLLVSQLSATANEISFHGITGSRDLNTKTLMRISH
jgi:hypothetical protein